MKNQTEKLYKNTTLKNVCYNLKVNFYKVK